MNSKTLPAIGEFLDEEFGPNENLEGAERGLSGDRA